MAMTNCLTVSLYECECEGKGETLQTATEAAFTQLRSKVSSQYPYPIITMQTKSVQLIEKQEETKKEAFLYVFAKRETVFRTIKLKIQVEVSYLKIE